MQEAGGVNEDNLMVWLSDDAKLADAGRLRARRDNSNFLTHKGVE